MKDVALNNNNDLLYFNIFDNKIIDFDDYDVFYYKCEKLFINFLIKVKWKNLKLININKKVNQFVTLRTLITFELILNYIYYDYFQTVNAHLDF